MNLRVEIDASAAIEAVGDIKRALRKRAGIWVRNTVHVRTQAGKGESGDLPGYSTNALGMAGNKERSKRIVTRGTKLASKGQYFAGGYKAYKKKSGQTSERFTFTNRGHFWRDWKVLDSGGTDGDITIGVSRAENAEALWKTFDDQPGRARMLYFNSKEMDQLGDELSAAVADAIAVGMKRSVTRI